MKNDNFKKALIKYGDAYIDSIIKQLLLNDKKATGHLIDNLDYKVVEVANGFVLEIIADPYLVNVDKGRKPGKLPNVRKIQTWAAVRRISFKRNGKVLTNEQVGWAISKSIEKKGIKPAHIFKKAKANFLSNKKALNEIIDGAKLDLNQIIKDALKNFKNQ